MPPHVIPLWLLRVVAVLHAALAVSQPLTVGRYLDGVIGALTWHGGIGSSLIAVTMLMGALSLLAILLGGSFWLVAGPAGLFVAETAQVVVGYSRALTVHVPLGLAIVAAACWYAVWLFGARGSAPRPRRAPFTAPMTTYSGGPR